MPADIVIAITCMATPGASESSDKPVGTVFVHGILHDQPLFSEKCLKALPKK